MSVTYNGIDYISLFSGIIVGLILYQALDFMRAIFGWNPKKTPTALSEHGNKELDFIFEKTGLKAHKVGDQPFNGFIKISEDPDAEKVKEIIYRYSNNGFVFTDRRGRLFGRVCTIWKKAERIQARRTMIKLVINNNIGGKDNADIKE